VDALLRRLLEAGGSDLHLRVGQAPILRRDGGLKREGGDVLSGDDIRGILDSIMGQRDRQIFAETWDADFAYEIPGVARFRVNAAMDRKGPLAVFRIIPSEIPTCDDIDVPKPVQDLCLLTKGLVVVTGPTGSGKSTTLAAMVDKMNREREDHILTIEDPIEFVHESRKCLVTHRQVGEHTKSFKSGLRAALREDPDIILIGELRDLETVAIAIETAETGHLVFGTLHTTTAASTVERIIDQFPGDRQAQIRVMLSESLRGVVAQTLLRKKGGGRVAAREVLLATPAISNLIREGKTFQIPSIMQTSKGKGMCTLNDSLMELVDRGVVEPKEAYMKSIERTAFLTSLKAKGIDTSFVSAG
jgi:twitching motility protein PilT